MCDIHGISMALCMPKIGIEEDHKLSAQHQHRINSLMQELMRKVMIKLLDAKIVYTMFEIKWVSPV